MTGRNSTLAHCGSLAKWIAHLLRDAYLFLRLSVLGFTAMLPLLGALSVSPTLSGATVFGSLAIALCFHTFAYVLNDVVDLDIDRQEPQRADDPLVRGVIHPTWALTFALVQVPLTFIIGELLDVGTLAIMALVLSFAGLAAYNVWGKCCAIPLVMDAVQALGWSGLVLYGAFVVGSPGERTGWLVAAVFAYVLLINGVHGGLRDLANDIACKARTTAIYFGAYAGVSQSSYIPPVLIVYAIAIQASMFFCVFLVLGTPAKAATAILWWLSAAVTALVMIGCLVLSALAYRERADLSKTMTLGTCHLYACLALLALPVLAHTAITAAGVVIVVYTLPIIALWYYRTTSKPPNPEVHHD